LVIQSEAKNLFFTAENAEVAEKFSDQIYRIKEVLKKHPVYPV